MVFHIPVFPNGGWLHRANYNRDEIQNNSDTATRYWYCNLSGDEKAAFRQFIASPSRGTARFFQAFIPKNVLQYS